MSDESVSSIKWVVNDIPTPQPISDICNNYYLVDVKDYGIHKAMFLKNESGEVGWYTNYFSKIIKPIIRWCHLS